MGSWPAELDGTLGSGQPAHLSHPQVPGVLEPVPPIGQQRGAGLSGQPRSPAGTLTPLGVFSAELSLRVLSVVAIYYCHGHHMLDLSVSKTIKEIHLLLTYDRCKTDCFLGSVLGANCGSSKSLFKASSFPQLLGAGVGTRLTWELASCASSGQPAHGCLLDHLPSPWPGHL